MATYEHTLSGMHLKVVGPARMAEHVHEQQAPNCSHANAQGYSCSLSEIPVWMLGCS